MEEDIHKTPKSHPVEARVAERLKEAIDTAQERIDYDAAHNPLLIKALDIVKGFIQSKGRVCYGGTAMNAILPPKKRFYDPEHDLPDYDFFTPDAATDVEALVADLKAAGFKDVYHRVGMHEGTKKILVNFVAIADISAIPSDLYAVFWRRAVVRGGIRYTDPDVLRMMMYLELSRPRGEVERWEKVYERLQLINTTFPPKRGGGGRTRKVKSGSIPAEASRVALDFCIENQRVLLSGPLETFYKSAIGGAKDIKFPIEKHTGAVVMLSPTPRTDAKAIAGSLGGPNFTRLFIHGAKGEVVPEYVELHYRGAPSILLFQEAACHSFLRFDVPDGRSVSLASLDTLITMYYAIGIFTKKASRLMPRILGVVPSLIALVERNRRAARPGIPAFPLGCRGYQKGYATLLREKVERIQREKAGESSVARKRSLKK